MNNPAAYTPLESLLLFQSLLTHGVEPGAFSRISELLRNNALIKGGGETYDPARLNPDALQQLFLLLLRDELKIETGRTDAAGSGGDGSVSPTSRKRKLASPPLPTIADIHDHVEKIPALVDRLYARYRDHIVKQVREDEGRFEVIQSQIQVLERAERERMAKVASQGGAAPISRDGKPPLAAGGPPAASTASQANSPAVRKPPTPVLPPKPPSVPGSIAPPKIASPAAIPPATTAPVRPTPSPQPQNGSTPVLQAPAGVPPPSQRVLQPPTQPPKQAISPRPDAAAKGKDAGAPSQPPTPVSGPLKWERPYQPQAMQAPAAVPPQPIPSTPQKAQQHQQIPHQQQQAPQQVSQQPQPQPQPQPQRQIPAPRPIPPPTAQAQTPTAQPRPPARPALVPPSTAGPTTTPVQPGQSRPGAVVPPQVRPTSTTPVIPPTRPVQAQQAPQTPRPVAAAAPTTPAPPSTIPAPQRWQQAQPIQQNQQLSTASPAPPNTAKDKPYASPYVVQPPRPPIPEHMIRQAASTPGPAKRPMAIPMPPQTPIPASPASVTSGFGTKWASHSTPSTPGPLVVAPESPAYEPVSPPQRPAPLHRETPKSTLRHQQSSKPAPKVETSVSRPGRGRPPRSTQKSRGASTTPSAAGTRRSQSVASQTDELSLDTPAAVTRIKDEEATPRLNEDTGDTTADESAQDRPHVATPSGLSSRLLKRKRQSTPLVSPASNSHVLWTRGFTKVSSSALDQISSHRDANMFATGVRERDAPNYRQIVLQPQDITSIRSAIKQGNKAAVQAANSLPGGDPGTASVWLPWSEDLVPPRGIVNSAQLERELVHMFCNAIMYNPDPDRGPGSAFLKRSQDEEEEVVGYHLDENGVVKNTQSMFLEVEKLLGDLRSAEKERSAPPPSATRMTSVATPADDTQDDEDELAGDGDAGTGTVKRRRITTRG
ncbi:Mitogen-activated protein kinase-binding protein 1 [Paramyrothecium foliicola]|nr:Mitogen-activated protein kinase-binding protein 1 [Paramyrothecium foliicola]